MALHVFVFTWLVLEEDERSEVAANSFLVTSTFDCIVVLNSLH